LTNTAELRTLLNVAERKKLTYDPWEPSFVNALARQLSDETGMEWTGRHQGDVSAVPEAALFSAFRTDDAGRQVLAGVMLMGDAITAEMLRKVPVAALENSRNLSQGNADDAVREELAKITPLQDADRSDPEAFSRLVAEHYRAWARVVPHPAAAMARHAGVKSPTVHTWIREARLRGLLPPAKRGKAR
jgi:hypothetical protein